MLLAAFSRFLMTSGEPRNPPPQGSLSKRPQADFSRNPKDPCYCLTWIQPAVWNLRGEVDALARGQNVKLAGKPDMEDPFQHVVELLALVLVDPFAAGTRLDRLDHGFQ
jgi:hypothetical protein